jgi:GalNAc5-diNAcBac-PP-undecaprenol beta-1,3-glucosyltransferase
VKTPLVSVVIATHSRALQLKRALLSIKSRLLIEHEIIVVSDVDCEATRAVCGLCFSGNDSYYQRVGCIGPSESRNFGLSLVRGLYVVIFDDDDEIAPNYMDFLNEALKDPISVSYGGVVIANEDRERNVVLEHGLDRPPIGTFPIDHLYVKNFIFTQAAIFPVHTLKGRVQDRFMRSLEDWEFLLNIYQEHDFAYKDHLGAIIYKDFTNPGNRRGSSEKAKNFEVVLDYLYVYRRWPAPTDELKRLRAELIGGGGLPIDPTFL